MTAADEVHFDGWTLRRQLGELQKNGTRIRLQIQPLSVLEELLAHPGELVTRERLIARLWPQGVVDFDTALNSTVHRLRTALEDPAEQPRYIETIPRRGYRFIGRIDAPIAPPPEPVPAAPMALSSSQRRPAILAAMLLVTAVIAALVVSGADEETTGTPPPQAVASPEAREIYQRARHFFQRRGAGDLEHARKYFDEALAIDPDFAEAWAGLASVYWISAVEGTMPAEQDFGKLRDAAERALALDPNLAEAHVRLANYRRIIGDRRAAEDHIAVALELEPESPLVLTSFASMAAAEGRFAQAIEMQRRALAAEPLSHTSRYNLGVFLFYSGRREDALREMVELHELNPSPRRPPELHGLIHVVEGRFEEALALSREWPAGSDRLFITALANDGLGRRADSETALQALIEAGDLAEAFRIAEIHAHRGDAEQAFRWLRTGQQNADKMGWRVSGRRPV
ncbi:MAG: winged helix-turn-helix domain-containing protein [Pseudomonadota bacterium]|nr:winged helix-turn-helix domain-containing protein [Pseudomonadota bacterium]